MLKNNFLSRSLLLCVFVLPLHVQAETASFLDRYSVQRQTFLQLTALLESGEISEVKSRRSELNNYPLADYLDFLLLKKEINLHAKPGQMLEQVNQFTHDKRLHRKLLSAIKNRSAKLDRWQDYRQASKGDNVPVHPCDDLMSGFKAGNAIKFDKSNSVLWADVSRHTKRCDEAFAMLLSTVPDVPTGALWSRAVALLKRGDVKQTEKLLKYFNKRDRRTVTAWIEGVKKPEKILPSKTVRGDSVHHQEMAIELLKRWARKDLVAAHAFWRANAKRFGFSNKRTHETLSKYAVLAAKRDLPEAAGLLDRVEADRDVRFWRVRLALQAGDWARCLAMLEKLTKKEQQESRWNYWRGRCLEQQGFKLAAVKAYEGIADRFDYYGFLAADKLGKNYSFNMNQPVVSAAEVEALANSAQIARAIEYFLVDISWEGRREWNQALKTAAKEKYIAASFVAQSVGWHDRALAAMISAGERGALEALFPAPFESTVNRMSEEYSVEREFIYGVMRRESLFIADIKSSAGAVGLMQLMPATAKQMGKVLGIKAPKWQLIEGDLNIKLGVKYLDYLSGRFSNNIVLTSAAYNAGPSRVNKWIPKQTMAADVWAEIIPFDETRAYVQAVLFNTVVSQWLLNNGAVTRLQLRMPALSQSG